MNGLPARIVMLGLLVLGWAAPTRAESPDEPAPPLALRRVFVPADRMDQWPLNAQRYLPLDRAEFERLLASVPKTPVHDGLPGAQFTSARYTARVVNDQLQGEALLQVDPLGPLPAGAPWGACNLAVSQARWSRDPGRDATLGFTPEGARLLLVEAADRLQVEWSLAGRRDTAGGLHFTLCLPPCAVNELILELPDRLTPLVPGSLVGQAEEAERGQRRWHVELAGSDRVELYLIASSLLQQSESAAQIRQTSVYDFSLQGVEVSSQWSLDVPAQPLSQVALRLDPGLQLIAARCDDQPLSWDPVPQEDQTTRVQLSFPEPLQGAGHQLRVRALAALSLDKTWRLPRIRAEGLFWQQGEVSLLIPWPLTLSYFTAEGCRQSGAGPLPSPRNGESADFEFFSPDGTLDLVLQRRKPRLEAVSATTIDLSPGEAKAQVNVELRMTDGELFSLEGDLARGWTISSLESVPADLISDWSVDPSGNRTRLEVLLSKAISPTRPVRLRFSLRRPFWAIGKRIGISEMVPLHLSAAAERSWLALRTIAPYELRENHGDLERIDPKRLDPRDLELFAERPEWLLDLSDPDTQAAKISLARAKPSYRASIAVEILTGRESLSENYVMACTPQGAPVDRLLVQFSPARDGDLRWVLGTEPDTRLPARRLTSEEQVAAGVPVDDEAWEVTLSRARTEPFELRASRSSPFDGVVACTLAALPDASQQRALVVLRSQISNPMRIQSRLTPVPPPSDLGGYPPIRRVYRYDPARDLAAAPEPPLRVAWDTEKTAQSWAWNCHLESHYQPDGSGAHVAVYRIQQAGGSRIRLSVPPEAGELGLRELWINQQRMPIQYEDDRRSCWLDLPPAEKSLTLMLHFATSGPRLGVAGTLRPPLPTISVPVLAHRWTVWLPPDYEGYDEPNGGPSGWVRRCFGPLACQPWRDPWSRFWPEVEHVSLPANPSGATQREALLRALSSAAVAMVREGRPVTWGRWLNHKIVAQLPFCLLIDRQELESIGLGANSLVALPQGELTDARIATLLEQENLAILLAPETALLTSEDYAALHQEDLDGTSQDRLYAVRSAELAEELQQAAHSSNDGLIRVKAWKSEARAFDWTPESGAGTSTGDHVGWHAYRPMADAGGSLSLRYARPASIQLGGCLLFIGIVALGWWRRQTRPARWLMLLALAGSVAGLVPAPYVPLSAGAVLGLIFCLVWRIAFGPRPAPASPSSLTAVTVLPSTRHAVIQTSAVFLLGAVALDAWRPAWAETEAPTPPGVYDVLVPVDSHERPTGRWYVPAPLYDRLNQAARAGQEYPREFLLRSALYRGVLVWQASPEQMTLAQFSVSFDLEVFRPGPVRIPLAQQASQLVTEQAMLDGRPIAVTWEPDGKAFSFQVDEPGPCRLYCPIRPPLRITGGQSGFDVEILPLPCARLELMVPAGAAKVQVPSALGAVTWESDPARVVAALGPASRLSVTWDNASRRGGASEADVEELLWLRVQPTSVVLESHLDVKGAQGPLREVQLAADPRLRLVPPPEKSPIAEVRIEPGQPQIIHLELARPTSEAVQLQTSFLLAGSSGLGRIRLPQLETINTRPIKRYLAVSVDPSLIGEPQGPDRLEPLAVPDFLAEWGSADSAPQTAYRLPSGPVMWTLATRAAGLRPTVDQTLSIGLDEQQAELRYEAQIDVGDSRVFQYRLTAPPGLNLQRVSLMADGVERVGHWSQQPDGTICLFLSGAAEGAQELLLCGTLPITDRGRLALPVIELQPAQVTASVVRVLRKPNVSVKIGKPTGLTEIRNPVEDDDRRNLGRLVKAYTVDPRRTPATVLTVSPNRPNLVASQLTLLTVDADRWSCEVRLLTEVKQGVLDQIQLEVPGWWSGPFEVDPPEPFHIEPGPGGHQILSIEPRAPWRGRRQIRVRAPLACPNGVPEVPLVQLVPGPTRHRFVGLPQGTAWDLQGLKPGVIEGPLGEGLGPQVAGYVAVANPYHAALKPTAKAALPQVALADFFVAWQPDGTCRGVAVFDLDGPADGCELALPSGHTLLQIQIGGVAVLPEAVSEGRWRIPPTIPRLPQTIEVLFAGPMSSGTAREYRFEAPRLVGPEVRQTLWTVAGPTQLSTSMPNREISMLRADLIRADQLEALLQRGSGITGLDPEDLARWHQLLQRRLSTLKNTAESALIDMNYAPGEQTEPMAMLRNELQDLDRPLTQIAQWLARNAPRAGSRAETLEPSLVRLWHSTLDLPRRTRRWAFDGEARVLSLTYPVPQWGPGAAWVQVLLWLGLASAVLWSLGRKAWREQRRWPLPLLVAPGVAWWLWLWPCWVGVLMILAGVIAWLRARRLRRLDRSMPAVISLRAGA